MSSRPPDAATCPRCNGTGRERSKEHTTRAACWSCGGSGRRDAPVRSCPKHGDRFICDHEKDVDYADEF
jgi:DnaJ-class molecular chaperone